MAIVTIVLPLPRFLSTIPNTTTTGTTTIIIYHKHWLSLSLRYSSNCLVVLQLFVVDLVDIGLLNITQSTGRRRLNQIISQLSDVIQQGLTGTVSDFRFGVTSLRQCTSGAGINTGCSDGTLVAKGPPLDVLATMTPQPSSSSKIGVCNCITCCLLALMAFLRVYR